MAVKTDNISQKLENLVINNENSNGPLTENTVVNSLDCDLPLDEVYKLALCFYKEKEGKAVHFSYEDKLQLVAFSQQVSHGPLADVLHKLPVLGALDVVGKDRRLAWQKLGNLTADQARSGFIELLSRRCPLFTTYIEAHRREKKERERRNKENERRKVIEAEEKLRKQEEERLIQEEKEKEEAIRRQIQQALNAQTFDQFKKYAEQQFPGDTEKQGALIRQLQDQHYIQYMQQLQSVHQKPSNIDDVNTNNNTEFNQKKTEWENDTNDSSQQVENDVQPASMWTRPDVEAFKQAVSEAEGDGVVRVGHGETVTVRVPTHANASRLFWEFATDHYDIAVPELKNLVQNVNADDDFQLVRTAIHSVLQQPKEKIEEELNNLIERISKIESEQQKCYENVELIQRLSKQFPGDVGIFMVYFLNHIKLKPGEAIYLAECEPHAYLCGDCVECMACSDNVVRAGLTPKFIDVDTLVSMLTYQCTPPEEKIFWPCVEDTYTYVFQPPVPDFAVAHIKR